MGGRPAQESMSRQMTYMVIVNQFRKGRQEAERRRRGKEKTCKEKKN